MITELPDALVLGAGGTLGEAWLRGVLNGIEAGSDLDFRYCEYLLGTSAGSIVAATLAGGRRPEAGEGAGRGGGGGGGARVGAGDAREGRGAQGDDQDRRRRGEGRARRGHAARARGDRHD